MGGEEVGEVGVGGGCGKGSGERVGEVPGIGGGGGRRGGACVAEYVGGDCKSKICIGSGEGDCTFIYFFFSFVLQLLCTLYGG